MTAAHRRLQQNRRRRKFLVRPRVFGDRSNPLETLEEFEIYQRYRYRSDSINFIVDSVYDQLITDTKMNNQMAPPLHVLLFLRFVATGVDLRLIGDSF